MQEEFQRNTVAALLRTLAEHMLSQDRFDHRQLALIRNIIDCLEILNRV